MQNKSVLSMGNAVLALRLVIGWTFFSAFWRKPYFGTCGFSPL